MQNPTLKMKRNRGSNFSKEEDLLLLFEVEKLKKIIECKMNDKVSSTEKNEAWRQIQSRFNAKNTCSRTIDQLKIKYDNIKCKARKLAAENKKHLRGTGGGPAMAGNAVEDPVYQNIIRIIDKTSVVGLENPFDSDVPSDIILPLENSAEDLPPENPVLFFDEENLLFDDGNALVSTDVVCVATEEEPKNSTDSVPASNLQQFKETQKEATLWDKYTPKKLKTPMSLKLRQIVKPKTEEYLTKKTEYYNEEIKKSKLLQEELKQKQIYAKEEQERKMQLLELEIQIKQKILSEK